MIENDRPVIANSLWTATANPAPDCQPLIGASHAQVAIVGGGLTGLSAALHLAEAGRDVALVEAESIGWGASGRNGGQVNPGLHLDPDEVESRFGPEFGPRIVRTSGAAPQLVFDLIDRHQIRCDARRPGWIRAAHNKSALGDLDSKIRQWAARGTTLHRLDQGEMAEISGTDTYAGGLLDPRGGNLHPLNYTLGLAHAAQRAGARLHGQSRALRLSRDGTSHILQTDKGQLRAQKVLLCTNGYTDDLAAPLKQTVVPVRSVQVATEPLPEDIRRTILPGGHAVADSRRLMLYYRVDAQGRLIMGGRGAYGDAATAHRLQSLRDVSRQMFPQLGDCRWVHAWGGFVAMTADHLPHLTRLDGGILSALGYNGRGVAMATVMGKVLADWACGTPDAALPFPVAPPRPIPFHGLRRLGVAATVAKYRALDALGL
ncbi:FAD-binding oxidoreductase [Seohaeicola saemankumensis]|nr:FAD-binding oxidoreductase [Seohaeicola saemankumensis]MCA0872523.1 FAD-binding oxidoreductase [Seohaeicola saemankumensis]